MSYDPSAEERQATALELIAERLDALDTQTRRIANALELMVLRDLDYSHVRRAVSVSKQDPKRGYSVNDIIDERLEQFPGVAVVDRRDREPR